MGKGVDFLLCLLACLVPAVICAGVNFGIAYAMYHSQTDVNFFPFPNTIAGDLAVTNFIQAIANYVGPNAQIELDSRNGRHIPWRSFINPPLGLVESISKMQGTKRRVWDFFAQSEDVLLRPFTAKVLFVRLFRSCTRGLFIGVFLFLLTWSLSVAILCPIYCDHIGNVWAPQGIKGTYGGVHAIIETPIAAFLILLSIDIRNYGQLPTTSKAQNGNGHVGQMINADTQRLVAVDTRTNQPLQQEGETPSSTASQESPALNATVPTPGHPEQQV